MSRIDIEVIHRICSRASELVMNVYRTDFDVEYKGPSDPVTTADRLANELICNELTRAFPDVAIVAEESSPDTFANFRASERVFFVDPVDGTREFIAKNGEFVVMIGLLEGDMPTAAVIQSPATGITWLGVVGDGAYEIAPDGSRSPISVSRTSIVSDARIVTSRSHRTPRLERALATLGPRDIEVLGSAGLKGAAVARGAADAYVAPDYAGKRWDACAAEALVVAAGGRVSDAHGRRFDYRAADLTNDTGMVASNGLLHDKLLERLESFRSQGD